MGARRSLGVVGEFCAQTHRPAYTASDPRIAPDTGQSQSLELVVSKSRLASSLVRVIRPPSHGTSLARSCVVAIAQVRAALTNSGSLRSLWRGHGRSTDRSEYRPARQG